MRLFLILLLSSLGGSLILHFIKNFFLEEKIKFHLDWAGIIERLCITYIIIAAPSFWPLIVAIIAAHVLWCLTRLGKIPSLLQRSEAGTISQKILIKSEFSFDIMLSPAFAVFIGIIFK